MAVVLFVFLNDLRTAFISLTAIPLSLLTAITVLWAFGVGLNTLTIGGLAIAVGEVVDDAIIDVENIHRRLRENRTLPNPQSPLTVIYHASSEVRTSGACSIKRSTASLGASSTIESSCATTVNGSAESLSTPISPKKLPWASFST